MPSCNRHALRLDPGGRGPKWLCHSIHHARDQGTVALLNDKDTNHLCLTCAAGHAAAIPQASLDSLPARSTDAKATRVSQDYRLTTRGVQNLTGTLRFHQQKYDNKTPERTFIGRVRLDQTFVRETESNDPVGNEQMIFGADLDYDLARAATVGGTYEYRKRDRTFREVEEDAENVFGVRARTRPMGGFVLHADYLHGDRQLDHFLDEDYQDATGAFVEQPGLRRFDVADRLQDRVQTDASWSATERVSLTGGYGYERNDYHRSQLGLRKEERHSVDTDASAGDVLPAARGHHRGPLAGNGEPRPGGALRVRADGRKRLRDRGRAAAVPAHRSRHRGLPGGQLAGLSGASAGAGGDAAVLRPCRMAQCAAQIHPRSQCARACRQADAFESHQRARSSTSAVMPPFGRLRHARLHAPGDLPTARLNAREKAASFS